MQHVILTAIGLYQAQNNLPLWSRWEVTNASASTTLHTFNVKILYTSR